MGAHRDRQLDQRAGGVLGTELRFEPQKRAQHRRTIRHGGDALIDHLDLVTFDDRDVDELAEDLRAAALDDQQPGRNDFDDEAEGRQVIGGAPHHQFLALQAHAEMNAGAVDGGRDAGERFGRQNHGPLQHQRPWREVRR